MIAQWRLRENVMNEKNESGITMPFMGWNKASAILPAAFLQPFFYTRQSVGFRVRLGLEHWFLHFPFI